MISNDKMEDSNGNLAVSYRDLVERGKQMLLEADILEAETDSRYLLEFVKKWNRSQFFLHREEAASEETKKEYQRLLQMRKQHIPLQYITGEQEFMGLSFRVNEHVLIPRQDTEILVETALPYVRDKKVLDLCTGSGCIAVSLMHYGKPKECHASDLSAEALAVAKKNAERNQAVIHFVESDLFDGITQRYHVIVSNPPYIPPDVIEGLMAEVRQYEPRLALDGGRDGLMFYRRITENAISFLEPGGYLFYEIGHDQAETVAGILQQAGFSDIVCRKDYAGHDRVVFGQYKHRMQQNQ